MPGTASPSTLHGPLHGLKVIDLTSVLSGPYTTQILGDLGAEVIKVEGPAGDTMRSNGVSRVPGLGHIFVACNRNKKSVMLDLKTEDGRHALRDLLKDADVLVHNMRLAAMERLGFSYPAVRALNGRIIYCSITGFGSTGPRSGRPAFDDVIQAASGMVSLNSDSSQPRYVKSAIADKVAGLMAANAVLAAAYCRATHGMGQEIEVPMLETMVAFNLIEHMGGLTYPDRREPAGYQRMLEGGRRVIPTQDGALCIMPYGPQQWKNLLERVGEAPALESLAINSRAEVSRNVGRLNDILEKAGPRMSSAEWLSLCESLEIACGRINPLADVIDDEHLVEVGLFQRREHPMLGPIIEVRHPVRYGATPVSLREPAPTLGAHNAVYLKSDGDPTARRDSRPAASEQER